MWKKSSTPFFFQIKSFRFRFFPPRNEIDRLFLNEKSNWKRSFRVLCSIRLSCCVSVCVINHSISTSCHRRVLIWEKLRQANLFNLESIIRNNVSVYNIFSIHVFSTNINVWTQANWSVIFVLLPNKTPI